MELVTFPKKLPVTAHTDFVGQGTTFVAIQGMKENGLAYIPQALERGATTIVIEEGAVLSNALHELLADRGITPLFVPCTRRALAELSAEAHAYPARGLKLIGVTGTKGKTTTAFLIEHLLRSAGHRTALISTVENRILSQKFSAPLTTPQPDYLHAFFAQCRSQGVEYVVMEVAAQALSLERLATLCFDTALFTNFSLEHSEFYSTQDDYFKAKCLFFEKYLKGGRAIFNNDDLKVAQYARSFEGALTYGIYQKAAVQGTVIDSNLSHLMLKINGHSYTAQGLLGDFNASNILAAYAAVKPFISDESVLSQAIASFEGVPGRLQRYILPNHSVAFIDNAHTPSSVEAVLAALRPLTDKLLVVLGAGGDRDALKRPIMGKIAAQYADTLFVTTDNPRSESPTSIADALESSLDSLERRKVIRELDREEAIKGAYSLSKKGTIIALLGKGPVEYQEINGVKIPFSEASILKSLF